MLYLLTNLGAGFTIMLLFFVAWALQKRQRIRSFPTLTLTFSALLCALSVVLTNVVGYNRLFGVQIMLGNFLIYFTGMLFGPLIGAITGLTTDVLGLIINPGGSFHAGFLLIKVLLGMAGGLVFFRSHNRGWKIRTTGIFTLTFLLSALLSALFLWSLYGPGYSLAKFGARMVRFPVEAIIYNVLILVSFETFRLFTKTSPKLQQTAWFLKNGPLKTKPKKSWHQKYRMDLDGNRFVSKKQTNEYYAQILYNKERKPS